MWLIGKIDERISHSVHLLFWQIELRNWLQRFAVAMMQSEAAIQVNRFGLVMRSVVAVDRNSRLNN
jgi:hypothetical protein